jgi:hypothetical protein
MLVYSQGLCNMLFTFDQNRVKLSNAAQFASNALESSFHFRAFFAFYLTRISVV